MSADKTVPPAAEEKKEDNKSFDEDIKHSDPVEIRAEDTSKPFDVFLSHNWGNDTRGRDNHARVKILCEELESKGIKTWCDEYDMEGNILESMAKGMDQSKKVIVFVTKEYIKKANGEAERGTMDNVYREFNYISNHFQSYDITPVVMEEGVKCMSKWCGTFGISLIGQLYVDYTEDLGLSQCLETLQEFILGKREISYNDGSFYEGPVNDKMQRHGYGKLTDRHGNVYEGKFNEDKKDDRHASILYKKSGVEFEGRFKNDKICPSTRGTLTLKDGTVMKGSFVGSKKIGIFDGPDVTLTYAKSGNKYIGDIKANKIEGRGRMEYKDGAVYEGSWQNGKKHGSGRMNYQNGDVYSGQWKNNMRHGKGKLDLANHDRYIGYFRNDMMQGKKGTYLVANGSKYEGGFVKNQRCGNGTFTSEDDRVSCGQWKDDKLHGKGYREYSNGDKYYGYFKESQRNGEGEMLFASSALYAGQWREDRMRQGVFDFEQVERNRKKKGWSSLKANSQAILCTIQFKDNEVNEWAALSPKRVRRKNLFSCKSSEAISFVSEDFVNKSEDFITNLGMTGLSEKYSKNLSSDHSRTISSSPLGTPKRGASLILPFSPADTVLSEESFVNHTDFDPYLVKKVDVGGICK